VQIEVQRQTVLLTNVG